MTIVVSDLVAKVRAEGVQEAATAVRAVGQEAAQTTRALEIMAAQFAKMHGGTAAQALDMFQRTGAQPTAAAMAEAARSAEKTTVAVQATVPHVQAAAKAAAEVHDGFRLSESSAVRFGAGILGIGLGLNLAAGAASLLHRAIEGVATAQLEWERSLVRTSVLYGTMGPSVVAISQAQSRAPGLLGSQQEFASANLNAAYLSNRFGISLGSITGLTSASGRVSSAYGYAQQEREALQARALAFAEGGGSSLRDISGTEGDALSIARRLGGVSGAQLGALTPQQLREAQLQIAAVDLNRAALQGTADQRGLIQVQAEKERLLAAAQGNLQNRLEGGPTDDVRLRALITSQAPRNVLEAEQQQQQLAEIAARSPESGVTQAQAAFEEAAKAVKDTTAALAEHRAALERLGVTYGTATFRLLGFEGSLEDPRSIARLNQAAAVQSSVAGQARSALPLRAMPEAERNALALDQAFQEARQNYVANDAQRALRNSAAIGEEFVNRGATGAIADAARRYQGYQVRNAATSAGDMAGRAGTEAQAQLSALDLQSESRRLAVAEQLAGYRREALGYEAQMAPLLSQQAMLQDRMVVAARDNLDSRRALIQAERAAQGPASALAERTYEQQRLELRAQISRASVRRGEGPTEDIAGLRRQYRETELHPELDLAALDSQHAVDAIQRQRAGEGLGRDLALTNLEGEQRALDNQLIPLAQAARLVQDKEAAVSRTLALLDLEDTKQRTAAQLRANEAAQLGLTTQAIARMAEDYAAGLNLGATAAERSQVALEKARDAIKETIPLLHTLTSDDTGGRIANGLGAGGLGPTRGGGFTIIISPTAQTPEQVKTEVHIQVENALNQFFAGASTTGQPAPATVGGAGR